MSDLWKKIWVKNYCSLRNETIWNETKWKSVVCEMRICSLRNALISLLEVMKSFPFSVQCRPFQDRCSKLNDFPPKGIPAVKWHVNNKNFCWKHLFSCNCLSIQNVTATRFESKQQSHNDEFYRFVWIARDVSG